MAPKFVTVEGNVITTLEGLARKADLIVEGGAGDHACFFSAFRDSGFRGPYVAVDIEYRNGLTQSNDKLWYLGGNCFKEEDVEPVFRRLAPRNAAFLTANCLTDYLLGDLRMFNMPKREHERIGVAEAVEVLTRLPYEQQVHFTPSDRYTLVCAEDAERVAKRMKMESGSNPKRDNLGNAFVLWTDNGFGHPDELKRLVQFVEESERRGWNLSLTRRREDVLCMARGKK